MTPPELGPAVARIPDEVRAAFPVLEQRLSLGTGESGLLHDTRFLEVEDGRAFVLQRVNDVFSPEIHGNIERVTRHLAARGLTTFRLEPTRDGALFVDAGEAGRWRLMTRLPGASFHTLVSFEQAESAAALVGRFHAALDDFDGPLAEIGIGFRDTPRYRTNFEEAIAACAASPWSEEALALRDRIDEGFERLGPALEVPTRVIHGDLKISNVIFEGVDPPGRDRARALIDFDTLMRGPLWSEWGDAWRSWCNRGGEDDEEASFDLEVFAASVRGFARGYGHPLTSSERASLVHATERLALELATRYATDMLEESYFGWDRARFPRAGAHHRVRARGQLALFEAAWATADDRREILEAAQSFVP